MKLNLKENTIEINGQLVRYNGITVENGQVVIRTDKSVIRIKGNDDLIQNVVKKI